MFLSCDFRARNLTSEKFTLSSAGLPTCGFELFVTWNGSELSYVRGDRTYLFRRID